jgi:hypothetical protein
MVKISKKLFDPVKMSSIAVEVANSVNGGFGFGG